MKAFKIDITDVRTWSLSSTKVMNPDSPQPVAAHNISCFKTHQCFHSCCSRGWCNYHLQPCIVPSLTWQADSQPPAHQPDIPHNQLCLVGRSNICVITLLFAHFFLLEQQWNWSQSSSRQAFNTQNCQKSWILPQLCFCIEICIVL